MYKISGFSYIELLIVVAIIGMLAGFGMITYPGIQKSARDAQRESDLKQYQTALEGFANRNGGFYPARSVQTVASDIGLSDTDPNLCNYLGMDDCPADPKYGQNVCFDDLECNYYYTSYTLDSSFDAAPDASRYVLYSRMERSTGFFVYCSNGSTGIAGATFNFANGACPF